MFHSFRVPVKKNCTYRYRCYYTNVYKLDAMVRECNTGWACNVFRNIDPDFIVHHFVHGGKSCNLACQL